MDASLLLVSHELRETYTRKALCHFAIARLSGDGATVDMAMLP